MRWGARQSGSHGVVQGVSSQRTGGVTRADRVIMEAALPQAADVMATSERGDSSFDEPYAVAGISAAYQQVQVVGHEAVRPQPLAELDGRRLDDHAGGTRHGPVREPSPPTAGAGREDKAVPCFVRFVAEPPSLSSASLHDHHQARG